MRQTRALLLLLLVAVAARGQASPDAPADKLTLLSGTVAVVANSEDMNGKKMKVGDEIPFTLRRDLRAGHFLVLREGTPLTARVKSFVPAHKGTGDQVELEFAPVPALDATPIRLTFHAEADTGQKMQDFYSATVGTVIFAPVGIIGGLFYKGGRLKVPAGSQLIATLEDEAQFDVAKLRPEQPQSGNAMVMIYSSGDRHSRGVVWCGDVRLGEVDYGTAAERFALPPGRYAFSADYGKPVIIDLAAGDDVYIAMHAAGGFVSGHAYLVESNLTEYLGHYGGWGLRSFQFEDREVESKLADAPPEKVHWIPDTWKEP